MSCTESFEMSYTETFESYIRRKVEEGGDNGQAVLQGETALHIADFIETQRLHIKELHERIEAYQDYINEHQQEWKTVTKTAEDNETTVTIRSKRQMTSFSVYFADETEGVF